MAHAHDLHVMPQHVGWTVAPTLQDEPLALTRTRDEAVALAMRMQLEDPDAGEILVHGPDGEIRERAAISRRLLFPFRH